MCFATRIPLGTGEFFGEFAIRARLDATVSRRVLFECDALQFDEIDTENLIENAERHPKVVNFRCDNCGAEFAQLRMMKRSSSYAHPILINRAIHCVSAAHVAALIGDSPPTRVDVL